MAKELNDAALRVDGDTAVRAVVLTGTGKAFCAGGDLGEFVAAGDQARSLILQMTAICIWRYQDLRVIVPR